jgi:hypothetical protein
MQNLRFWCGSDAEAEMGSQVPLMKKLSSWPRSFRKPSSQGTDPKEEEPGEEVVSPFAAPEGGRAGAKMVERKRGKKAAPAQGKDERAAPAPKPKKRVGWNLMMRRYGRISSLASSTGVTTVRP